MPPQGGREGKVSASTGPTLHEIQPAVGGAGAAAAAASSETAGPLMVAEPEEAASGVDLTPVLAQLLVTYGGLQGQHLAALACVSTAARDAVAVEQLPCLIAHTRAELHKAGARQWLRRRLEAGQLQSLELVGARQADCDVLLPVARGLEVLALVQCGLDVERLVVPACLAALSADVATPVDEDDDDGSFGLRLVFPLPSGGSTGGSSSALRSVRLPCCGGLTLQGACPAALAAALATGGCLLLGHLTLVACPDVTALQVPPRVWHLAVEACPRLGCITFSSVARLCELHLRGCPALHTLQPPGVLARLHCLLERLTLEQEQAQEQQEQEQEQQEQPLEQARTGSSLPLWLVGSSLPEEVGTLCVRGSAQYVAAVLLRVPVGADLETVQVALLPAPAAAGAGAGGAAGGAARVQEALEHVLAAAPALGALRVEACSGGPPLVLPALPAGLVSLHVAGCPALTALPALPAGLVSLHVAGCPALTALPALPAGLVSLHVVGCPALTALPALPIHLRRLRVEACPALAQLPPLPHTLRELSLKACPALTRLPPLPFNMTQAGLHVEACPALVEPLPVLPDGTPGQGQGPGSWLGIGNGPHPHAPGCTDDAYVEAARFRDYFNAVLAARHS